MYVLPLLLAVTKLKPLVGPTAPRFENSGIFTPWPAVGALLPIIGYSAPGVPNALIGEVPAALAPPTAEPALPNPNPSCVPMSRAKLRVAATTRASISTSCVLRSSCVSRRSIGGIVEGMSLMITAFVRSSATTSPRELRNFLSIGITSFECA